VSWFKFGFGKKKTKNADALPAPEAEESVDAPEVPVTDELSTPVSDTDDALESPAQSGSSSDDAPSVESASDSDSAISPNADEVDQASDSIDTESATEELANADQYADETVNEQRVATEADPDVEPESKPGFFARLARGLRKSSSRLSEGLSALFTKRKLDQEALDDLEELLIAADIGAVTAAKVIDKLARDRFDKDVTDLEIREALAEVVADTLQPYEQPLDMTGDAPRVVVFVGVNGSGKTTTLGKIAVKMTREGADVITAAGDTFRAAAVEQLQVWSDRAGAKFLSRDLGADAAGLAFDAIQQGRDENADAVLIDTAGRLQNKAELMDELKKIIRVIKKIDDTAPHHVLLVLDGTVGSNALSQAEAFLEASDVTGVIMTKLDGTAKGGALVQVAEKFKLPIHFIGVGEGEADLQAFIARDFARALAGLED